MFKSKFANALTTMYDRVRWESPPRRISFRLATALKPVTWIRSYRQDVRALLPEFGS